MIKFFIYMSFTSVAMQFFLMAVAIANVVVQGPISPLQWTTESALISIGRVVITVLVAIIGWMVKKQLDTILHTLEVLATKQSTCREDLPGRYADKEGTARNFKEIYGRIDRHDKLLERHCVLIGGRRAGDLGSSDGKD